MGYIPSARIAPAIVHAYVGNNIVLIGGQAGSKKLMITNTVHVWIGTCEPHEQ